MESRLPQTRGGVARGTENVPEASSSGPDPPRLSGSRRRRRRLARLFRWTGLPWRLRPQMPSTHGMTLRTQRPPVVFPPGLTPSPPILGSAMVGALPPPLTEPVEAPERPVTAAPKRASFYQGSTQMLKEEEVDSQAETETGPFLSDPVTPPPRPWYRGSPQDQNFVIFEDVKDEGSPRGRTPVPNNDPDEERENRYGGDYEIEDEPIPPRRAIDWSILEAGPRDAFGLPFDFVHHATRAGLAMNTDTDLATATSVENTPVPRAVRATLEFDDEMEEDWDESVSDVLMREYMDAGDFNRSAENVPDDDW